MGNNLDDQMATAFLVWSRRAVAAFAISSLVGGVCIPGLRYIVFGDIDPFSSGWPLYLEISAFVSAITISFLLRCPFASAFGLYAGLAGLMLFVGESEYPIASAIGLAVHGLIPAALGAAVAYYIRSVLWSSSRRFNLEE